MIPGIKIEGFNNGLTLETNAGMQVKAVFEGKVTAVFDVEGSTAVIAVHGKYFTTYSNLVAVTVKTGDTIKTGQVLGKAQANKDGNGEIEFVLMDGISKQNLDPETWLTGK